MIFSRLTVLWNYYYHLIPECFNILTRCPLSIKHLLPISPFFHPWATIIVLSVSIALSVQDISHQWSYTMCGLLCLLYFTSLTAFKVHVMACIRPSLFLIDGQYFIVYTFCLFIHQLMNTCFFLLFGSYQ